MPPETVLQQAIALRRRAEARAAATETQDVAALSPDEVRRLLHELRVHQIELEMQNEELCRAQVELEGSRARYFDLYHLAPVGYLTVSERGLILEANLRAAALLGMARETLVKRSLSRFILPADSDAYHHHHKRLFRTGEPQACEVRLAPRRAGAPSTWVRLEAVLGQDEAEQATVCRVILRDVTERKALVAELERHRSHLEERVRERTRDLEAEIAERIAAQAAQRRSEASLVAAERIAHVGSWDHDLRTGAYSGSDELYRIFGFCPGDPLITPDDFWKTLCPGDGRAIEAAYARTMQTGEPFEHNFCLSMSSGETRVVHVIAEAACDPAGQPVRIRGVAQDITEHERIIGELDQRVRELTNLQELGRTVSFEFPQEEIIRIYLERLLNLAGLDLAQVFLLQEGRLHLAGVRTNLVGKAAQTQVLDVGECLCGQAVQDERTVYAGEVDCDARCTRRHCHVNGLHSLAALPLRSNNRVIGVLAAGAVAPDAFAGRLAFLETAAELVALRLHNALLHQEIRQRAAGLEETVIERTRELQAERDRTHAILETVGESVVVTDLDGQLLFINPATTALTGQARDDALGQPLWHGWAEQARTEIWPEAQRALRAGQAWHGEISGRRRDGTMYIASLTGTPLYDADVVPSPVGAVWAQRDITVLKESVRLKDQFVANVSHELRTPISIIALGCDNLETFYDRLDESQRRKIVHDIQEQIHRLSSIVADTLQISQIDAGRAPTAHSRVDLARLVREEADGLQPFIGQRGQRLDVSAAAAVEMQGNEMQLRQIVRNLLDNARKYTLPGGQISCTCETRAAASAIARDAAPGEAPAWAVVEVTDNGIGIDARDMPYVFERFYRVNGEGDVPGTGLGLPIAQKLAQLHDGWIAVASTPGQGSTFTVYLPLGERRGK